MNNYFAVLGRNKWISQEELEALWCVSIEDHWVWISFDHDNFESLNNCGWAVKWWSIITQWDIAELCADLKIVWVSEKNLWNFCKKECWVRRRKEVDLIKTDLEIKQGGKEFLSFPDWSIGYVQKYQDIPRFETIDFERPVRGMQVGMMPAKLTQILVNIGVWNSWKITWATVFDPFCGFGTTWFIANSSGHNFIWSDINPTPTKQNLSRWKEQPFRKEHHFTVFKHDVLDEFTQPFLSHVDCIVTEWRLWPILSNKAVNQLSRHQLNERREAIFTIYSGFLDSLQKILSTVPIVITYPQWTFTDENLSEWFIKKAQDIGYDIVQCWEVYTRKGQNVWRRILVLTKKR